MFTWKTEQQRILTPGGTVAGGGENEGGARQKAATEAGRDRVCVQAAEQGQGETLACWQHSVVDSASPDDDCDINGA